MRIDIDDQMIRKTLNIEHLRSRHVVFGDSHIVITYEIQHLVVGRHILGHALIQCFSIHDDHIVRIYIKVISKVKPVVPVPNSL